MRLVAQFPLIHTGRLHHCAGNAIEDVDTQVHFHPGKAHLLALFGASAIFLGVHRLLCVGVDADGVAPFAAKHLVDGYVVYLASDVPERHLYCADAAGLAPAAAELRDLLKQVVDAQRILADDATLEHHGILRAGDVAHFAQTIDAVVGVDADEHTWTWSGLDNHRVAHIGDLQTRRTGSGVHISDFRLSVSDLRNGHARKQGQRRFDSTAAVETEIACLTDF